MCMATFGHFYLDKENKHMRFDVVLSFDDKDRKGTYARILEEVQAAYPDYTVRIAMDLDLS